MSTKKEFLQLTITYFLIIIGFLYLYIIDVDKLVHPSAEEEVKSKVDFVYSQF